MKTHTVEVRRISGSNMHGATVHKFGNVELSIAANRLALCHPREDRMELKDFSHVEVQFRVDDRSAMPSAVHADLAEYDDRFNTYDSCTANRLPLEQTTKLVERVYQLLCSPPAPQTGVVETCTRAVSDRPGFVERRKADLQLAEMLRELLQAEFSAVYTEVESHLHDNRREFSARFFMGGLRINVLGESITMNHEASPSLRFTVRFQGGVTSLSQIVAVIVSTYKVATTNVK